MRKLFCLAVTCTAFSGVCALFCSTAEAQWGTLKGQVVLDGDIPEIKPLVNKGDTAVKDAAVCAAQTVPDEKLVVDPATKGIANVFVFLVKKPAMVHPDLKESKEKEVKFDQKGCRFLPHAMLVRTDQRVRVMSDDDTGHNTHSNPTKNTGENFLVTPKDRTGVLMKPLTLSESIPTNINCDIHAWMKAYWLILDHPYAAVTDEKGHFEIKDLPVGNHDFKVWQETCGWLERKLPVKIAAGMNEQKPLKYSAAQILK